MPIAKRRHKSLQRRPEGHSHKKEHAVRKLPRKKLHLIIGVASFVGVLFVLGITTALYATEGSVQASLQGNKIVPVQKPIVIHLNKDLAVAKAKVVLKPHADIRYTFSAGEFGQTILTITPTKPLQTNHEYKLEITQVQYMVSRRNAPSQVFSFRTELAPGIAAFSPTQGTIKRDTVFTLQATDSTSAKRTYTLALEPKADLQATYDGKTTIVWKPKLPLQQGVAYKLKLLVDNKPLQEGTLQTISEPKIVAASAKEYFHPDEKIAISFDKPMRTDQKDKLIFPMNGEGGWINDTNYIFTPKDLERNKEYTYTIKTGLESKDGGIVESDKSYKIKTPGPAIVVRSSPFGSGVSRSAQVRFSFDQRVHHASAEARFSISPAMQGSFRWEGETLVFTPSSQYEWQTTYTATILPGVGAIYGVSSTQPFSVKFTTEVQAVRLNTPVYRQTYRLSCEASALRMAMATFGTHSDDMTILNRMGYTPRPLTNGQWEDPYQQFVGDVNGRQWDKTGYGVYAGPVAAAARSFGRGAIVATGVSAQWIAGHIHQGHPVVVWGYLSSPTLFTWTTPGGKTIQAWQGEHTRTVIGVVGKADSPQGFYVADPASGSVSYMSIGSLMANMNVHGNLSNQAVAVY